MAKAKKTGGAKRKAPARSRTRSRAKSAPHKKAKRRVTVHQTGTSNRAIDKRVKAKPPGKRKAHKGAKKAVYYEYRKNRSDMPGKLTGTMSAYNEMILSRIKASSYARSQSEKRVEELRLRLKGTSSKDKAMRAAIKRDIDRYKKHVQAMRADITMLKRLIQ